MSLSIMPPVLETMDSSREYHFLFGHFRLGTFGIPYAVLSMPLDAAALELKVAEEATPVGFEEAGLEELYQRKVDWDRVLHQIVPYLKNPNQPQFFNALTIALLPYVDKGFVDFEDPELKAPSLPSFPSGQTRITVGPVSIGLYSQDADLTGGVSSAQLGVIRWNRDQVRCIAIDGQHRLGALQKLKDEEFQGLSKSHIPVILVIPAAALGLVSDDKYAGHVRLMRKLFTDLNRHSVPVSRSRQILLDDYDPQSLCVRRSLQRNLIDVSDGWRSSEPDRIPLALVDWHTDDAKFSEGPYVTTLLALDQLIGSLIRSGTVRDWTDVKVVSGYVKSLEELGWSRSDECASRLAALGEKGTEAPPFTFPDDDLEGIQEAFARRWCASIVLLLSEVFAYRELIELRRRQGMLSPNFVLWYDAYLANERAENAKTQERLSKVNDYLKELEPKVYPDVQWVPWVRWSGSPASDCTEHKARSLFFRVVSQRALFFGFAAVADAPRWDVDYEFEELDHLSGEDHAALRTLGTEGQRSYLWARDMVDIVNQIEAVTCGDEEPELPGFFELKHRTTEEPRASFWYGTVAKAGEPDVIDFTNAAAKRAANWFAIIALLHHWWSDWAECELQEDVPEDAELGEMMAPLYTLLQDRARQQLEVAVNELCKNKQGGAMRYVVQALNPNLDLRTEQAEARRLILEEFWPRFRHVAQLVAESNE